MGSVSQSTRGVFFWLRLLCVVVDVHTAVVVTATSPFSAHVRGHTIGVTIDRGVFFCLLVCVSAVVYHTYCCSSHCYIHRFRPMFAGTRSVSQSTAVCFFASSSCVTTRKLRLSHNICHRKRGVRGVLVMPCYAHCQVASVVCYAVLCHGRVQESYFRRFPV